MPSSDSDMTSRVTRLRPFVEGLEFIISTFTASSSKFHRIATLDAYATWPGLSLSPSSGPALQHSLLKRNRQTAHKVGQRETLIVLDASFNPPSGAHAALALAAIARHRQITKAQPNPCRLLLLLGTRNADKHAAVPASHAQRLAMLVLFATDLRDALSQNEQASSDPHQAARRQEQQDTPIDIGLASIPYMADKAAAIEGEQPPAYAQDTRQVHVMGHDTIVRVLAPRYYADFGPPLSALEPLFGHGHEALVVLRPTVSGDRIKGGDDEELNHQRAEVERLVGGELGTQGFKEEWQALVDVIECKDAANISSTAIRAAAAKKDHDVVQTMCTPSVAAWIRDQALYDKEEIEDGES